MASYFKRYSFYVLPGAVAAAGILQLKKFLNDERNVVHASWPFRNPHAQTGDGGGGGGGGGSYPKWDPNWDKRNPEDMLEERGIKEDDKNYEIELEKSKPKATRNLFLIRHGQYNVKGNGDEERTLTALGREQAEYTGKRLKELNMSFSVLHRSTLTRAQETADIILECFKDNPIPEVRNCNLLEEGAPILPDPPIKHWKPEAHQFFQDGVRIEAAFRKYFHRADTSQSEDSYEIVVCHANVIRYFFCRALQLPPEAWLRLSLSHCSITWFVISPSGRVMVRSFGDAGHLPVNAVTSV